MISCLRLYAAAIVAVLEGLSALVIDGVEPFAIGLRLVLFGGALAMSIHELRDERRRKR